MATIRKRKGFFGINAPDKSNGPSDLLLSVGPTGHYLINPRGKPVQIRGDSPWGLSVALTRENVTLYFDNRKDKKFNSVLLQMIEVNDGFVDSAPANAYGDLPFGVTNFTTYTEAYWRHIDYIISQAAYRNIIIFASALYLGFNGGSEGWYSAAVTAGTSAVQTYGEFLGVRYKNYDNIIWVNGGDYRPPTLEIPNALATGIKNYDTRHLITTHWARNSTGTDGSPTWLTLNSSYTSDDNISSRVLADYQATPILPTFLIESRYEGSFSGQPALTTAQVRTEAWQAYLSGACGNFYGHHTIWPFDIGWEIAMESDGAQSLKYMHVFFDAIKWWTLEPDNNSTMVTAGRGTLGTATYVTAGKSSDGKLAVVYIPNGGQVTINMGVFSGIVIGQWFDPNTGIYSAVSGSPFTNSGSQNLDPIGSNNTVLLLEVG